MRFISTRGGEKATSAEAIRQGIAADGGLFVPEKLPEIRGAEMDELIEASYPERAAKILKKFFPEIDAGELLSSLEEVYSSFDGDDPAPLVRVDDGVYILELFHGPTCSSRDMAVAALPYLFKKVADGNKIDIIVATSGDSGKAALELFKDRENCRVLALYPAEGVSKMQKLQLAAQEGGNVDVVAVKGSFDDCQSAVKTVVAGGKEKILTANSMNFAAFASRIAYYFSAYADLLSSSQIARGEEIDFFIPCGNGGDVVAAYYAKLMGLPIRRIHCASNENDAASEFLKTGAFDCNRAIVKTTSPSLDVLAPSDFERLAFEISGRDARLTAKRMQELLSDGAYRLTENETAKLAESFDGGSASEETCVEAMYDVFVDTGYTMDTCTGCAMKVAHDWYEKNKKDETKAVIVAVNSPFKFPQDVLYAITGNDVKDSFKGVKRLRDATAMTVPQSIKELRDKPLVFTRAIDKKNVSDEAEKFFK